MRKLTLFVRNRTNATKEAINRVMDRMAMVEPDSDEYQILLGRVERLYKLRSSDRSQQVSWDTIVRVVGSLVGVGIVVGYERTHVIASKGISFVPKP